MIKPKTKKVCIVVSSLGVGGAERSSAELSELLFELGYEIHLISVLDKVDYPFKGKLLNLGKLKAKDDSPLGRFKRLLVFRKYLKDHNFDYVIDNRTRIGLFKEFVISKWIYNPKNTIYCVRSYSTDMYINPNKFFGRWLYKSAYKVIAVSNAIADKIKNDFRFKNLKVVHNFVTQDLETTKGEEQRIDDFILFYGRLDDAVKNISLLLEAYSKSKLPKSNMKLKILGNGKDKELLKQTAKDLNVNAYVEFLDFQSNPYSLVKTTYFTVLTSRYEGFPRVLIESLSVGTPVVSVDCKSGPNEIVIDGQNGLLVENNNVGAFSKAMDRMLEEKNLYLHCKSNAKTSVRKFSKERIGLQWKSILK